MAVDVNGRPGRIAVIGGGISGITAAHILSRRHEVTLFERNAYLGGHTNTIVIKSGPDAGTPVDTGFIVCNSVTYPNFYRFLDQLGVELQDSDMSFGYSCEQTGIAYLGPALSDFLRTPRNFLRPGFSRMLLDQFRFNREGVRDLERDSIGGVTLGDYVRRLNLSAEFTRHYLIPLSASIWSSPELNILDFPAVTFLTFFRNHGMLELRRRPQWQCVRGGSHAYVDAFRRRFTGTIRLGEPVQRVRRGPTVELRLTDGSTEQFDGVVMAAHADESLALLEDPSSEERRLLGAWRYHRNRAVLHTARAVLPPNRRLWASWNYRSRPAEESGSPVGVTYYMNRLQRLRTRTDFFVTLNGTRDISPRDVLYETEYTHPEYGEAAVSSQASLRALNGTSATYYCGAYCGYGFHEDGVTAAIEVGRCFGLTL